MPLSGIGIPALKKIAHRTVMCAGVTAIGAMTMLFVKPELAERIKTISPFAQTATVQPLVQPQAAAAVPSTVVKALPEQRQAAIEKPVVDKAIIAAAEKSKAVQPADTHAAATDALAVVTQPAQAKKPAATPRDQAWVTEWLAKRYRVASDAAHMLVATTYNTATEIHFDPLLILAVIAIESGFNPLAESPMGAKGLMQVMADVHHDKFRPLGGVKAALNPVANIKVGSTILRDYVRETGSLEGGLKRYVGAAAFDNDAGYGWKVLAEYRRLKEVASGKRVPVNAPTLTVKAPAKPATPPAAPQDKEDVASSQATVVSHSGQRHEADADGVVSASL
jgi:soluble lytic murein transglycosylase-like protein